MDNPRIVANIFGIFLGLSLTTPLYAESAKSFEKETKNWRKQRETKLLQPMGWLEAVGLFWLQNSEISAGSSDIANFKFPSAFPKSFALIRYSKDATTIEFLGDFGVEVNHNRAEPHVKYDIVFASPDRPEYTSITYKSFNLIFIERKYGKGLRIYDTEAENKKKFKGQSWFAPDLKYKINAKWVPLTEEMRLSIPDTLGHITNQRSPGYAVVTIDGAECKLYATEENDELFFIFKDASSGKDTYGAGRFLTAKKPIKDIVVMDFNRAENPPCAFSPFGTCPLPPKENNCALAIPAGEMNFKL